VVDVAGYPVLQDKRVILTDALFRDTGERVTNQPVAVTATDALNRDMHAQLVRVQGKLVQNTIRGDNHLLVLDCDGMLVEATLPKTGDEANDAIARLKHESLIELTGVSKVMGAMEWSGLVKLLSVSVMLRSPLDIHVLSEPSWWTTRRLLGLVGILAGLIALGAVWVTALRKRVAAQTEIIKEKVEREALWRDRSRIAQDIHDDVGASLTQVAFLSQRVQVALKTPDTAAPLADKIESVARSTIRALDEIVWAVNPRHDTLESLADYLCQLAREQFRLTPVNCLLDVPAVLPEVNLRAEVRHNVALAVKEALHNVVKHSGATNAELGLKVEVGGLTITVRDDGRGFDPAAKPASRNGLFNIERRMKEIAGSYMIESTPKVGTFVRLQVPLQAGKASVKRSGSH
jgi:signal transduction histidine kinase